MPYTKVNLRQVEDSAPKFGHGDNHEARFANKELGLQKSGMSYQKLFPGKSSPFDHSHNEQEEVYIILGGGGTMKLDGETIEVGALDAIRVDPETARSFAAGSEGLEFLVYGAPATGLQDGIIHS
jgi:uncharacterized cupin superfamily protein